MKRMILRRECSGSGLICRTLERLGISHVFGLPGTQNVPLFEALRCSTIRTVLATHEAAAGFMANGYFRSSGRVAGLITISGPGFTNALTALAEARQDSVAVLYLVNAPPEGAYQFKLQELQQSEIASTIVKRVFTIHDADDVMQVLAEAYSTATSGEPGPVMVEVRRAALDGSVAGNNSEGPLNDLTSQQDRGVDDAELFDRVASMLQSSKRPVIYAGQGCNLSAHELTEFAEWAKAPVIMTRSARGVVAMDHPIALAFESSGKGAAGCNAVLHQADLVLVLGCKLGHNGTAGFRIEFPPDKTIHVDASAEVLQANYPVRLAIQGDVGEFLRMLLSRKNEFQPEDLSESRIELKQWHDKHRAEWGDEGIEPDFPSLPRKSAQSLFAALRSVLPRNAILVTDSGLHQVLSFRYWQSLAPAGIIAPTDFQSMGFGISAAIGAKLACPDREVVAVIGDGGLAMSGMELLTAVRENLSLTVIAFNDGALGQIRLQQMAAYGSAHATTLTNPNISLFAQAIGATYNLLEGDLGPLLSNIVSTRGVKVFEVPVSTSSAMQVSRAKGMARRMGNDIVGRTTLKWIKSKLESK